MAFGVILPGTIQADGLSPLPAFGVDQTFDCPCRSAINPAPSPTRGSQAKVAEDDQEVIRELIKVAEERRLKRAKAPGARQP